MMHAVNFRAKAKSIALPAQLNVPSSLKTSLGIYAHT